MQLNEQLQSRLDTFQYKFGKDAEKDENRIWLVTNTSKPEHERVPTTINGSVISKFIFNGYYDIQEYGVVDDKNNAQRKEARRREAQRAASVLTEAQNSSPQHKKLKEKE